MDSLIDVLTLNVILFSLKLNVIVDISPNSKYMLLLLAAFSLCFYHIGMVVV